MSVTSGNNDKPFRGWIANLSDGTQAFEGPVRVGKLTPWQALRAHCQSKQLVITSLRLQIAGITLVSMANAHGYVQCTEVNTSLQGKKQHERRGIGSVVGGHVMMLWTDGNNVWQDLRTLEEYRVHAVLLPELATPFNPGVIDASTD